MQTALNFLFLNGCYALFYIIVFVFSVCFYDAMFNMLGNGLVSIRMHKMLWLLHDMPWMVTMEYYNLVYAC